MLPILVCTYTNVAVDNLVEGFVNAGLDPVRIGYGQIRSASREYSLEFKVGKHPLHPKYNILSEKLKELEKDLKRTEARIFERQNQVATSGELSRLKSYRGILRAKQSRLSSEEGTLYRQIQAEVMVSADVVCFSTPHTSSELIKHPGMYYLYQFRVSGIRRYGLPRRLPR